MSDRNHNLDDRLLDLLYDELAADEAAQLRIEMEADPELETRLHGWASIRALASDLEELDPDPQVHYSILRQARIAASTESKSGVFAWFQWLTMSPTLAALGLMIFAGSLYALMTGNLTETSPEQASSNIVGAPAGDVLLDSKRKSQQVVDLSDQSQIRTVTPAGKPAAAGLQKTIVTPGSTEEPLIRPSRSEFEFLKNRPPKNKEKSVLNALPDAPVARKGLSSKPEKPTDQETQQARSRSTDSKLDGYGGSKKSSGKKKSKLASLGKRKKGVVRARSSKKGRKTTSRLLRESNRSKRRPPPVTRNTKASRRSAPLKPQQAQSKEAPTPVRFAPRPTEQGSPKPASPSADEDAVSAGGRSVGRTGRLADSKERKAYGGENSGRRVLAEEVAARPEQAPPTPNEASSAKDDSYALGERSGSIAAGFSDQRPAAENTDSTIRLLAVARRAQKQGDHRRAIQAYEAYMTAAEGPDDGSIKGQQRHQVMIRTWYEAALSYQVLGNHVRARMLLRRVAKARSPYGTDARSRLAAEVKRSARKKAKSTLSEVEMSTPTKAKRK
jgi:hypothetical protein